MAKLKIATFTDHFFPIEVFFCKDAQHWHALLADKGITDEPYPENGGQCTTFDSATRATVCIVTMSPEAETRNSVEVMGIMAHELVHVKQAAEQTMYRAADGRGRKRLDIETEAYFMQKLLMWLIGAYADSGRTFKDD